MKLKVGDIVALTVPLLGNKINTIGVVYDIYPDFDRHGETGASIIFENGNYDGFSVTEQDQFLKIEDVKYVPFYVREYKFSNVMKLSRDFESGFWDEIFNN